MPNLLDPFRSGRSCNIVPSSGISRKGEEAKCVRHSYHRPNRWSCGHKIDWTVLEFGPIMTLRGPVLHLRPRSLAAVPERMGQPECRVRTIRRYRALRVVPGRGVGPKVASGRIRRAGHNSQCPSAIPASALDGFSSGSAPSLQGKRRPQVKAPARDRNTWRKNGSPN